jgi:hypothetical protein
VFPVRYELDLYILFSRNSVFKELNTMGTCEHINEQSGSIYTWPKLS